jgi:hypothetical protein
VRANRSAFFSFGCLINHSALFGLLLGMTVSAFAEDKQLETLTIRHNAPFEGEDLPETGKPIELEASVEGTKDTDKLMKLYAVKDGSLTVLVAANATLNQYDVPQYRFSLQAPKAELHYKFVLEGSDGELLSQSPGTAIRRPCINADTNPQQTDSPEEGSEQEASSKDRRAAEAGVLTELVAKSRQLEHERFVYDEALVLADQLVKELDELTPK